MLETYRECLRDVLDLPGLDELLREAPPARDLAGRGRDADGVAVRLLAAVRLRRDLHVRGRHAERRAPRRGAVAGSRPAARAARPGGAARPDRPRRARRASRRICSACPIAGVRPPATGCTTCSAARRPDAAEAAAARARGLDAAAHAGRAGARAPRGARPGGRRGALDRRRRRRSVSRRARRGCRPAGCRPRSSRTCPTRSCAWSGATRRPTGRSRPRSCGPATGSTASAVLARSSAPASSSAASCALAAPTASGVDPEVLRRLRRASLAVLRKEIEPADQRALARFLPAWQGVDRHPATGAGVDRLREVLVPLQGLALPPDVWERDVLPRRVGAYSPAWMDQLCASGEIVWIGAGALGRNSGRVALYFREDVAAARAAGRQGWAAGLRRARRDPRRALPRARASSPICSSTSSSRPRSCRRRCGTSPGRAR